MTRRRQLIILAIAVVAFAGMVTLVSVGVLSRRRNRDLMFGLEQLDVLIDGGQLAEAVAMVPWLADRADEANEMLSVLKRGVLLLDAGAGPDALDAAARSAITAFPGNESVRSIAVFAAVMSGDIDRAMRWGRDHLAESDPDMFAWVLLTSGEPVPEPGRRSDPPGTDEMTRPADEADPLFLVSLVEFAGPDDFLKAWRATGDWRYAADAAALRMAEGSIADAVEITAGASLALRAPLFAADIFGDAGDAESALDALRNAPREAAGAKLRMADALMSLGRFEEAESVYGELIASSSLRSEVPLVNMAWLSSSPGDAAELYDSAVAHFPSSWRAVEQRAIWLAETDVGLAFESLDEYSGSLVEPREELLRLRLQPRLDRRGYQASVWRLANAPEADDDTRRYAAWYLAGRGQYDAVTELLDGLEGDSSWVWTYRGIVAADSGRWNDAAAAFSRAYRSGPSWSTSLNLALSHLASGEERDGMVALETAEELARRAGLPRESAAVFVAAAHARPDRNRAYEAVTTALQLDPTNTAALLLRTRLESVPAY